MIMNKKMKTEKQMMKLPVYAGILFSVLNHDGIVCQFTGSVDG